VPVLRRVTFAVGAVVVASMLIFAATEALPGDYATAVLGQERTPALLAHVRHEVGLDHPAIVRYGDWLWGIARGNLGRSYTQLSSWTLIRPRLTNSIALAIAVMILSVPLSVGLGLFMGIRAGGVADGALSAITLVAISLPEFVIGLILAALFGIFFPILPPTSLLPAGSSGFQHPEALALPAIAAAGVTIGYIARHVRASTLDVLDSDYVRAARLRGITGVPLIRSHVLRNALIPAVTAIGNNVAWMLTGLVAVELVFAYPGIGSLLINAITTRDAPLIAAISLLITIAYVGINLLTDLVAILLNPRLSARN
jgi:peptide/nickel transport system permease protein